MHSPGCLALVISSVCVQFAPAQAAGAVDVETALQHVCQELLDAVASGDKAVWTRYLHDRVVHVDENGARRNKAELIGELTPLPPGLEGRATVERFKAEVHGSVAVATYEVQEHLDYFGQTLRSRFRVADTWLNTDRGWRLISEQVSAVQKDPPVIGLTQKQLCAYEGTYALTEAILATVRCTSQGLLVEREARPSVTYVAEFEDVFFVPGQPRTRRIFQRDSRGRIVGFVDRREGEDVRWVKRPR